MESSRASASVNPPLIKSFLPLLLDCGVGIFYPYCHRLTVFYHIEYLINRLRSESFFNMIQVFYISKIFVEGVIPKSAHLTVLIVTIPQIHSRAFTTLK